MILCYHEVDPVWRSTLSITPDVFRRHCEWLAENRTVVPLAELVDRLDQHMLPDRGVTAITFDDGFRGVHDHALPILVELGLPATVFVVTDTLTERRQPVDWIDGLSPDTRQVVNRTQIEELQRSGIDVQSHSAAHKVLPTLSDSDCLDDLKRSRETLEDALGKPVRQLAYPRGQHSDQVRRSAQDAGFESAYSLPEHKEHVGRFAVPRVGVFPGNGLATLSIKSSPEYLRFRHSGLFPWVRRIVRGN